MAEDRVGCASRSQDFGFILSEIESRRGCYGEVGHDPIDVLKGPLERPCLKLTVGGTGVETENSCREQGQG